VPQQRSHRRRSPAPGQLVLFDPFDTLDSGDVFAPPYPIPTALDTGDESGQDYRALLTLEPCAAPPLVSVRLAVPPPSPDQPEVPTVDLPTSGGLTVGPPSADGDLAPIVSPLVAVTRLGFSDEPGAEDHVYTPADLVVGPAARFEATLQRSLPSKHLATRAGQPPWRNEQSWRASAGSATAPPSRHSA
jgi:hypothetical protein